MDSINSLCWRAVAISNNRSWPQRSWDRAGSLAAFANGDDIVMSKKTRATETLEKAEVAFSVHAYEYDPNADRIGVQAAAALGEPPERVLKTLMALVDGKPVCVVIPSDSEVSMKKLASTFGGKSAQMMKPADAERVTGYKVGGISPFGQKRPVPTVMEERALHFDYVFINAGQRGLQVRLDPRAALAASNGRAAAIVSD